MGKANHAFTLQSKSGLFRELITDINVSVPQEANTVVAEDLYSTQALWDTGATNSVITASTVRVMGLKPISMTNVNHAGGTSLANVYLLDIHLPNQIRVQNVRVTECSDQAGSFGVIIGMDIISLGDFALTNVDGHSVFSFRLPSIQKIDYVEENEIDKLRQLKKIGRNAKCPCESGKKVKDCCGKGM